MPGLYVIFVFFLFFSSPPAAAVDDNGNLLKRALKPERMPGATCAFDGPRILRHNPINARLIVRRLISPDNAPDIIVFACNIIIVVVGDI